jgi:hypothetical protein
MTGFDPKGKDVLVQNVKLSSDDRGRLIFACKKRMYEEFPLTDKIGLCYLDPEFVQNIFGPMILDTFNLDVKITRAWGHFMREGGERPVHQHNSQVSFLYYLVIPENSAMIYFPKYDGNEQNEYHVPAENDLWIFPHMIEHGITTHKTKEIRWAIAGECELL